MSIAQSIQAETTHKIWQKPLQTVGNEQLVELLDNLGYVDININDSFDISFTEKQRALAELEHELSQSSIQIDFSASSELLQQEGDIDELEHITDIDGSFLLSDNAYNDIKSDPLLTRVLNFRLNTLGLTDKHQGAVFTQRSEEALAWLQQLFSISVEATISLTDNFEEIFKAFTSTGSFANTEYAGILYFNNPADSTTERRYKNNRKKFLSVFPEFDGAHTDEQKGIIRRTSYRRPTASSPTIEPLRLQIKRKVESLADTKLNAFGLRLIQLKMFLLGTYAGKLDSDMGSLGLQSVIDYRDMENHDEEKHIDEKHFVFRLSHEWWAINVHYFLNLKTSTKNEKEEGISAQLEDLSAGLEEHDKPQFYNEINRLIEKEQEADNLNPPKRVKRSRSFFQSVARFFKKMGKAMLKGIKAVLKAIRKLFNWIKNGIRVLLLEIKAAVQSIHQAISFVFSERIIQTESISTDFDMDFDVVSRLGSNETNEVMEEHIEKITALRKAINQTAEIVKNIVPVIIQLLASPIGWLKAGIALVKALFAYQKDGKAFSLELKNQFI